MLAELATVVALADNETAYIWRLRELFVNAIYFDSTAEDDLRGARIDDGQASFRFGRALLRPEGGVRVVQQPTD